MFFPGQVYIKGQGAGILHEEEGQGSRCCVSFLFLKSHIARPLCVLFFTIILEFFTTDETLIKLRKGNLYDLQFFDCKFTS